MTGVRFVIDDASQCSTQRAVLSAFAAELERCARGEIVRSSQLASLPTWDDAPAESSRRLGMRLLALKAAPGLMTVFLPGHVVPGEIDSVGPFNGALAARGLAAVADLDMFVVDNAHPELLIFQDFLSTHVDYESISRYERFSVVDLPIWLQSGGLSSTPQLHLRPWYSAFSPARMRWLEWVKLAMDQGLLDLDMVDEDIRSGLARPSLRHDFKALEQGAMSPALFDTTLDSLFVPPERRLTEEQYLLLHSDELQNRTVKFSRLTKASGKVAKSGEPKARFKSLEQPLRFFRWLPRLGLRSAYTLYAVTVRSVVKKLRGRGRAKS